MYSEFVVKVLKKLQAVKIGGLKKNSAFWPESNHVIAAGVLVPDDWIILKVLQAVTLQPFDPQSCAAPLWKDLIHIC